VPTATIPTAAANAVAAVIDGPRRDGRVVASTTHALFVAAGDDLLCVSGPGAVRLPCALLVTTSPPRLACGTRVVVGAGRLVLPDGATVRVSRWWRVPRPQLREPFPATLLLEHSPFPPRVRKRPAGRDLAATVTALLGRGPGLTPAGDDILAGMLVTLTAARHPAAHQLAAVIQAADPARRTTTISAALLWHAARGECIPPLAEVLTALDRGEDPGERVRRLRGVGGTSGTALLAGVGRALDLLVERVDRQECA
jgi:Protein of unknown function (DUF2877)